MNFKRNIIVTGGAGFIGSHVVRLFVRKYPDYRIINVDKLTYAGNLANLADIEACPNYLFVKADIVDFDRMLALMQEYSVDGVIHLAAEPRGPFHQGPVHVRPYQRHVGTLSLLQAAKVHWESSPAKYEDKLFYHISTDEGLRCAGAHPPRGRRRRPGSLRRRILRRDHQVQSPFAPTRRPRLRPTTSCGRSTTPTACRPSSPTAPTITGPISFPEKLIPLFINNIRHRRPLPVYGRGENVRDWLYVEDHARAIDTIFHRGKVAETYNIGGFNEWKNIDIVKVLIRTVDRLLGNPEGLRST